MYTKVKNLNGTSDNKPPVGFTSWKEYWIAIKGFWPSLCAAYGCYDAPDVGAHVKKVDSYDDDWYIVPLCSKHNNQRGEILYVESEKMVKANIKKR